MKRRFKNQLEELECAYDTLLGEKLELEYRCRELEGQYQGEKEQRDEVLQLHENVRKLKHDMKNHVMMITAYLQENEIEEAKQYLSKLLDKLNGMYTYIETANSLMSHVLNQKLEYAQKMGIYVKAQVENLAFERMESVDFVAMLSNLLDNAMEGVAPAAEGGNREIHIDIARKRGYETISVKNTIASSVLEENPELISTKSETENHGYGVRQIRSIVAKYEGMCRFYEENGMFCAAVFVPV